MCAANQIDVVLLIELANDRFAESEAHAAVVVAVCIRATLRIRPEQVAKESLIGHISRSHNVFYLIQVFEFRTQTTVHAENFLVNEGGDGQAVENVAEYAPESDRVATLALVIKAIDAVDLGTLVVTSEQEKVLRVLNFVAEEEADGLNGLLSSVDVVAKEEVVGLGREPAVLKDAKQVVVLAVNITTNFDRSF